MYGTLFKRLKINCNSVFASGKYHHLNCNWLKIFSSAILLYTICFAQTPNWKLMPELSDEFNYPAGTAIDPDKWYFQTDAHFNAEAQQYTNLQYNVPEGSHLTDYNLRTTDTSIQIVARNISSGNYRYTSCRINSQCRMAFKYGKIEFRLKAPEATESGLWPAVWMLGNNINQSPRCPDAGSSQGWPSCGEVDLWEYQSSRPNSFITNGFCSNGCGNTSRADISPGSIPGVWKIIGCEWSEQEMKYYYREDNDPVDTMRDIKTKSLSGCNCFKSEMFYLINLAVGGTLGGSINCTFPQTLELDYIRTYQNAITNTVLPEQPATVQAHTTANISLQWQNNSVYLTMPYTAHTHVIIYDLAGRRVKTLVNHTLSAGTHEFVWKEPMRHGVFVANVALDNISQNIPLVCE